MLSLIGQAASDVRSRLVPDVSGAALRKVVSGHVDMANTMRHTDEAKA